MLDLIIDMNGLLDLALVYISAPRYWIIFAEVKDFSDGAFFVLFA